MRFFGSSDRLLGLTCIALAVLALAIWIPLDIETGLVEKMRRRIRIGDALLPTLGLAFVIVGGVMAMLTARTDSPSISRGNIGFLVVLLATLAITFAVMRWLGPIAVSLLADGESYRSLRDTAPWKYIGYVAGGTGLVAGLMAIAEGRVTLRGVLIGLAASAVLVALYDLPFDDLLLPPNGDV